MYVCTIDTSTVLVADAWADIYKGGGEFRAANNSEVDEAVDGFVFPPDASGGFGVSFGYVHKWKAFRP